MKELFVVFSRKDILFDFRKDFNMNGEFHGVTLGMWKRAKQDDPKFGTYQNRAAIDYDADLKIRECQANKTIDPFQEVNDKTTYVWLVCMVVWILGRYFLTHGGK